MRVDSHAKEDNDVSLSSHAPSRVDPQRCIATMALTTALLVADDHSGERSGAATPRPNKKALVGSWLETVTFPPEAGRPPLKSLGTFHDDGTMACSDQGAVTTDPPTIFTSCHGAWTHLEQRTFAYTSFELISDLSGNLRGIPQGPRRLHRVSVRERVHRDLLRGDPRSRRQRALLGRA